MVSKLHQGKSSQKVCDTSEHFHPHSIDESVNFFWWIFIMWFLNSSWKLLIVLPVVPHCSSLECYFARIAWIKKNLCSGRNLIVGYILIIRYNSAAWGTQIMCWVQDMYEVFCLLTYIYPIFLTNPLLPQLTIG